MNHPWLFFRRLASSGLHRGLGWFWLACLLAGCIAPPFNLGKKADPPPTPMDSLVLGSQDANRTGPDAAAYAELDGAKQFFQQNDFAKAEPIFTKLAKQTKNPLPLVEEALFYQGECQRLKGDYRTAEGSYKKLLKDFRNGQYTDQANRRLFDIANYWLDETRQQMEAYEQYREGKRMWVPPGSYVHFAKDKPLFDMEGRAVQALEEVRLNDINGPLGEKALFYLATVKFFRADYHEADYYYTQLYQQFPNSQLAPKAIKQAIICKQICTGGSPYDGRTLEEARKLIDTAGRAYPQLASKENDWLERQLKSIHLQQADRDFNIAEFYRRTSKPGSAYFYYELVRRRYPGTTYSEKAIERMQEMRGLVEQEQAAQKKETPSSPESQGDGGILHYLTPVGWWKKRDEERPASQAPIPGQPLR